jgi:hypothetical protein
MNDFDKMFADADRVLKDMDKMMKQMDADMEASIRELNLRTEELIKEARKMKQAFTWSAWEPVKLKWPKRINQRWCWPGDTVYRRERIQGLTGSGIYEYGDEFNILKEQYND